MKYIFAIAWNTVRETIRKKHLYVLAIIAVVLIGFISLIVFFQESPEAFMKELSLFTVSFLGMLITILIASPQIRREMEDRSIYTILAKPVGRFGYITGKFIGASMSVTFSYCLFSLIFYSFLRMKGVTVTGVYMHALILNLFQLYILSAAAIFLSTIFTTAAASAKTILYFIGQYFSPKLSYPLNYFNINWTVVHNVMPVATIKLLPLLGMGIVFTIFLLTLGTLIFGQKEL